MAAELPFEPVVVASSTGKTVTVVTGSSGASIAGTVLNNGFAPSIMVTNQGPNVSWVRMSSEAVPTATQADTPLLPNTVRLFGNPVPVGTLGVAVTVSVTTSANTVYFTAGQGGAAI